MRLVVVIALVAAAVLAVTAVLSRQPDEPTIELIDVVDDGAPPDDGIVRLAVTTAVAAGPPSPPPTAPATTTTTIATTTTASTTSTTAVPTTTTAPPTTTTTAAPATTVAPSTTAAGTATTTQAPTIDPADQAMVEGAVDEAMQHFAPIVRAASADEPLRVYVGGDSLSDAPRWGLHNADANVEVIEDTRISTGIVADWYFDWVARVANDVAPADYDVVVLTMGGNDAQRFDPALAVGSEDWKLEYGRRVDAMMASLADGPLVVWIGMPPVTPPNIRPAISAANEVTSALAMRWPHVEYVDAYALFASEENDFATHLARADGKVEQVRTPDGVHYTPAAGVWLADEVLAVIADRMVDPITLRPLG